MNKQEAIQSLANIIKFVKSLHDNNSDMLCIIIENNLDICMTAIDTLRE